MCTSLCVHTHGCTEGHVHLGTQTDKCDWAVTPRQLVVKGCLSVCALISLIVCSQASSVTLDLSRCLSLLPPSLSADSRNLQFMLKVPGCSLSRKSDYESISDLLGKAPPVPGGCVCSSQVYWSAGQLLATVSASVCV